MPKIGILCIRILKSVRSRVRTLEFKSLNLHVETIQPGKHILKFMVYYVTGTFLIYRQCMTQYFNSFSSHLFIFKIMSMCMSVCVWVPEEVRRG